MHKYALSRSAYHQHQRTISSLHAHTQSIHERWISCSTYLHPLDAPSSCSQCVPSAADERVRGNIIHAIGYPERIFPVGRLDKESTGLILLTNDGRLPNAVLRR